MEPTSFEQQNWNLKKEKEKIAGINISSSSSVGKKITDVRERKQ